MTYVFQPYPAWRYHATFGARLVATAAEEAALGKGWGDQPIYGEQPEIEQPIAEAPPPKPTQLPAEPEPAPEPRRRRGTS